MAAIEAATATAARQDTPCNIVRLPVRVSRVRLADKNVHTLPGPVRGTAERLHYDTAVPWLALRIAGGRRTFVVIGRTVAGRSVKLKVGKTGGITVVDARKAARVVLGALARGEDPGADRKAARAARTGGKGEEHVILRAAADAFLRARERELRASTWWGYHRAFRLHALPVLGDRDVRTITTAEIDALHAKITSKAGPAAANRLRSALSALFTWAMKPKDREPLVERNPVAGSAWHKEHDRERVLVARELAALLGAARARGDVAGRLILFLALTACRKGEALAMRWRDVDLEARTWTKPAATTKGKRDHVVPLSPEAVALLRSLRTGAPSPFPIGPSTLHRAFVACCEAAGIRDARVHDLRRSAATALAMAGAPLPVVGRLLGHRPGSAITARIYARSTSTAEIEAAAQVGRLLA